MNMMLLLIRQILQMFLLAGAGYTLFKTKKISPEGSKALGNILIYLALPSVIINGFLVERTAERMLGILISGAAAAVLLLLSIIVSRLIFKKDAIAAFAGAFSNPGFFGIPLIIASVGSGAVFYIACFVAFLNIGQWTYGVSILNGQPIRQGLQPKKLIKAPFIIAILIGLALFLTQIPLPAVGETVEIQFQGLSTQDNIGYRYGLVAVANDNTPTYLGANSEVAKNLSFKNPGNIKHLYLVVVGCPTKAYRPGQAVYPYQIKFNGK